MLFSPHEKTKQLRPTNLCCQLTILISWCYSFMLPQCSALANAALLIFIWFVCACVWGCRRLHPNNVKAYFSCGFCFALAVSPIHQDKQNICAAYSCQSGNDSLTLWSDTLPGRSSSRREDYVWVHMPLCCSPQTRLKNSPPHTLRRNQELGLGMTFSSGLEEELN